MFDADYESDCEDDFVTLNKMPCRYYRDSCHNPVHCDCDQELHGKPYYTLRKTWYTTDYDAGESIDVCLDCWECDDADFEECVCRQFFLNYILPPDDERTCVHAVAKRAMEKLQERLNPDAPWGSIGLRRLFELRSKEVTVKPAKQ